MKRSQSGFTLIEIAIVLVIIGLLLGGVLKGQELINSAKVKNLAADFRNIPVFIYGYQDKFKALPGDDKLASTHLASGVVATTGGETPGNGVIEGDWDSPTQTDESYLFWQHIRLAGLAPGGTILGTADYPPLNAIGGRLGVTNAANSPIGGLKGSYIICSDNIPGKFAKQLDTTLDDGNTTTGAIQVTTAGTHNGGALPLATITLAEDTPYLVCLGI